MLIETHQQKLATKIAKCLYLGPNREGEGDRFYNLTTCKIIVSCNATFFENVGITHTNIRGTPLNNIGIFITPAETRLIKNRVTGAEDSPVTVLNSTGAITPHQQRYLVRERQTVKHFDPSHFGSFMLDCIVVVLEPKSHNDAMKSPDADKWKSTELNKIKNLKDNKT